MKGKSESEVAQSCPTLRDPIVCSLPGSSVHGIFQARVLEWGAIEGTAMNKTARSFDFCAGDRGKKKAQTSESTAENAKCSQHRSGKEAGSDPRGSTPHGELAVLSEEGVLGQNTGTLRPGFQRRGKNIPGRGNLKDENPAVGSWGKSRMGRKGHRAGEAGRGQTTQGQGRQERGQGRGSAFYCEIHCRRETQSAAAAAAAKSLQSCPTLCDPIDGGPPGSPVPGVLQARTLEWVAISFSNA